MSENRVGRGCGEKWPGPGLMVKLELQGFCGT